MGYIPVARVESLSWPPIRCHPDEAAVNFRSVSLFKKVWNIPSFVPGAKRDTGVMTAAAPIAERQIPAVGQQTARAERGR